MKYYEWDYATSPGDTIREKYESLYSIFIDHENAIKENWILSMIVHLEIEPLIECAYNSFSPILNSTIVGNMKHFGSLKAIYSNPSKVDVELVDVNKIDFKNIKDQHGKKVFYISVSDNIESETFIKRLGEEFEKKFKSELITFKPKPKLIQLYSVATMPKGEIILVSAKESGIIKMKGFE